MQMKRKKKEQKGTIKKQNNEKKNKLNKENESASSLTKAH